MWASDKNLLFSDSSILDATTHSCVQQESLKNSLEFILYVTYVQQSSALNLWLVSNFKAPFLNLNVIHNNRSLDHYLSQWLTCHAFINYPILTGFNIILSLLIHSQHHSESVSWCNLLMCFRWWIIVTYLNAKLSISGCVHPTSASRCLVCRQQLQQAALKL
jgi:hypothetical protein